MPIIIKPSQSITFNNNDLVVNLTWKFCIFLLVGLLSYNVTIRLMPKGVLAVASDLSLDVTTVTSIG